MSDSRIEVPNRVWCPWKAECTQRIPLRGRGSIQIHQMEPLPFELTLSVSNDVDNRTYLVTLAVNRDRTILSKTVNGTEVILADRTDRDYVLHAETGRFE